MHNKLSQSISLAILASALQLSAQAQDQQPAAEQNQLEELLVTGGKEEIRTLSGSAHLIDETALEQFDFSDLNQVLGTLPGLYIRQEDGFGLRPNIGVRGVTSDRSQKITLMEDGVLIKPAPYSAPAAYYIPNIARMAAIEVVKGPASIKYGPNNVGGAINLATQPVPEQQKGIVDISAGSDGYKKYQLFFGDSVGDFGYWIDALHYGSDGFKELDGGGDTGFERNDFNAKLQWSPDELFGYAQTFTLKVGFADEDADETYLGLTQADFEANPLRRYAASQLARFQSEHELIHFDHVIDISDNFSLNTKAYWNRFERSWNKLDGFMSRRGGFLGQPAVTNAQAGIPIDQIFSNPDRFGRQLGILRGEINSNGSIAETLDVTNNDREYYSSGIQFQLDWRIEQGDITHEIEAGLRFHSDEIERDHSTRGYLMTNGVMVNDGIAWGRKTLNEASADALALYVFDKISWNNWTFNAGIRFEDIESEGKDFLRDTSNKKSQDYFAPGLGAFWQFNEQLGFLVGINKGFSPAGATAAESTDPEESTNVEYGLRYNSKGFSGEVIGFFSDYQNLIGRCRASDTGCEVGEEFNGGDVQVAGMEVFGEYLLGDEGGIQFPINFSYTFTESAFQTSFISTFSQWGAVTQGDQLPYLPEHVGRLQVGAQTGNWEAFVAFNYQSEMLNQANRGSNGVLVSDDYTTVDLSASWQATEQWLLQLSVDNVADEEAIVSWRPFGARPNKPRTFRARVKYTF